MGYERAGVRATVTDIRTRQTPKINEVSKGLFIVNEPPDEALLSTGKFLTHHDFEQAGVDSGATKGRGLAVFNTIAFTSALGLTYLRDDAIPGSSQLLDDKLYYRILYMMKNPEKVKFGSRDRVLLETQFVHDTFMNIDKCWSVEGSARITGAIGQAVLHMVLFDYPISEVSGSSDKSS